MSVYAMSTLQYDIQKISEGHGYDGVLEPGMALCVEAYVGAVGGKEGVKLEDQVIITEDGFENLTNYPFEKELLK